MGIKAGINLETEQVYIETSSGGLSQSTKMDPIAARLLAASLVSAADNIDEYKRNQIMESRERDIS